MNLYIAEKPSLANVISQELEIIKKNNGYIETKQGIVTWCFGHMYENYNPSDYNEKYSKWVMCDLPIIPDKFKLGLKQSAADQVNIINELIEKCETIINCGDPDREGQLLVDEVIEEAGFKGGVKRAWLKDLSKTGLKKTLSNLESNSKYKPMSDAAKARSHLDWLVGLNLTRIYSLLAQSRGLSTVLSVGRVQTPTLELVAKRDNEINNFKSVEFYEIIGEFEHEGIVFDCKKTIPEEKRDTNKHCVDSDYIDSEIIRLNNLKEFEVLSVEQKEKTKNAPKLFSLGDLQTACSNSLGLTIQEILDIAQSLYQTHKITTYPRTDCRFLSEGDFEDSLITLKSISEDYKEFLDYEKVPYCYDDKKVTAHTAIIPNGNTSNNLNDNERLVYEIICLRFIAQFAKPYKFSETKIILSSSENDEYKAVGKVEIEKGYINILGQSKKDTSKSTILPNVMQGQQVIHAESKKVIKNTTPPKKFTEGTLRAAMENIAKTLENEADKDHLAKAEGIGTETTRSSIIETLKDREYLLNEKKNIVSSPKANNFLSVITEEIKSPVLTAKWEQSLNDIEQGKLTYDDFMTKQKIWIKEICKVAKNSDVTKFGGKKCPKCKKGYQTVKTGKKTKFIGCTLYPECDFVVFPQTKKTKRKLTRRKK